MVAHLHLPEQLVHRNPAAHRALPQGLIDDPAALGRRGQFDPLGGLTLDDIHALQLIRGALLLPAREQGRHHLRQGLRQGLVAARGEGQLAALQLGEPPGLQQQGPGEGADGPDGPALPALDFVVVHAGIPVPAEQDGLDPRRSGAAGQAGLGADGDTPLADEAQHRQEIVGDQGLGGDRAQGLGRRIWGGSGQGGGEFLSGQGRKGQLGRRRHQRRQARAQVLRDLALVEKQRQHVAALGRPGLAEVRVTVAFEVAWNRAVAGVEARRIEDPTPGVDGLGDGIEL